MIAPREAIRQHCSFCGKDVLDVAQLIAGPNVFICDECLDLCVDIRRDHVAPPGPNIASLPCMEDLLAVAERVVPGQTNAARALAGSLIDRRLVRVGDTGPAPVLVVGPRGSGKRAMIRTLCQAIGLPWSALDVPLLLSSSSFMPTIDTRRFSSASATLVFQHLEVVLDPACGAAARRLQHALVSVLDSEQLGAGGMFSAPVESHRLLFIAVCDLLCDSGRQPQDLGECLLGAGLLPALLARFGTLIQFQAPGVASITTLLGSSGLLARLELQLQRRGLAVRFGPDVAGRLAEVVVARGDGLFGLRAVLATLCQALAPGAGGLTALTGEDVIRALGGTAAASD